MWDGWTDKRAVGRSHETMAITVSVYGGREENEYSPSKLVLACVQEIFVVMMCWFETILCSPCVRWQRKLKVNTHEPNSSYVCDLKRYTDNAQPNKWKTHHALNIYTKINFVLKDLEQYFQHKQNTQRRRTVKANSAGQQPYSSF